MSDLSREARRVIELGRDGQDPTAVERDRVRARVTAGVAAMGVTAAGAGAATAATASSTAAGTGSVLGIKLAIVTAVAVGAGTVGTVVAVRSSRGAAPAPVTEMTPAAPGRAQPAEVSVPRVEATQKDVNRTPEAGNRKLEMVNEPIRKTAPAPAPATESESVPEPGSGSGSGSGPAPAPAMEEPETEPETTRKAPVPAMGEEKLLEIALDANRRKDYPSVLAATAIHAARFPRSRHALDRDTLRAIALCQTGRQEEGRWVLGPARRWLSLPPGRVNDILAACALAGHDGD